MADWIRKARRALRHELRPGEEVVAAVLLRPDHDGPLSHGLAATLPTGTTVLGLTTQRLLALGHAGWTGRPKGIEATLAPTELIGIEFDEQRASFRIVVHFIDGSTRRFDAPRIDNDVRAFAAVVNGR